MASPPRTARQSNVRDDVNDMSADTSGVDQLDMTANSCSDSNTLNHHSIDSCINSPDVPNTTSCVQGTLQSGKFMDVADVIDMLCSTPQHKSHNAIPAGLKENTYFVVNNSRNITSRSAGRHSVFEDDCGAWATKSGSSPKALYRKQDDGHFLSIVQKDGLYCLYRTVEKQKVYKPINPPPSSDDVYVIRRHYSTLKNSCMYKRRVTWLENIPNRDCPIVAIVEYTGKFPGLQRHGNAKDDAMPSYSRTSSAVMDRVAERITDKTGDIYSDLCNEFGNGNGPRDEKQIRNKKYNEKKTRCDDTELRGGNNFADQMQQALTMSLEHPFVMAFHNHKSKVPSIVLFNNNMCFARDSPSVFGIDKSFNLGDIYVTATSFKHKGLLRKETRDHPIVMGPLLLHGNSTETIFRCFLSDVSDALGDHNKSQFIIGSDEERALVNAINSVFPGCTRLSCTRHLKNNADDYLKNTVGMRQQERNVVKSEIFGARGLVSVSDTTIFDFQVEGLCSKYKKHPEFIKYFKSRLAPILRECVVEPNIHRSTGIDWTNNNSESLNHVLKIATEQQPLTRLAQRECCNGSV